MDETNRSNPQTGEESAEGPSAAESLLPKEPPERPEIRETQAEYGPDRAEVCVRTWESAKWRGGRVAQPWHDRLVRLRGGQDPRV